MPGTFANKIPKIPIVAPRMGLKVSGRKKRYAKIGKIQTTAKILWRMSCSVFPNPVKSVPILTFPTQASKLTAVDNVRKNGALGNFEGKRVLTIGSESAIIATVAGITNMEVYFTEVAKTVFSSSGSFSASTFTNVGNKAVAIGIVKNVIRTAKYIAAL